MINLRVGSGEANCKLCKYAHHFLYCHDCNEPLRMGNNRIQFCPKCKATETAKKPDSVLCCAECEKPLSVTGDGGTYCKHCDFHPSMQDTFLWRFSDPKCPT